MKRPDCQLARLHIPEFAKRVLLIAALCAPLAACVAASAPSRMPPANADLQSINLALTDAQSQYYYSADEPARHAYRNELMAARMYAIDIRYTEFEGALMRERQGIGFLGTTATLGLTGAVPLVDGTETKNILGAAAAFVTGTRAAYYDEVLQKATVQIIINQMRANRDIEKRKVLLKWEQSTTQYPIAFALSDVEAYYRAGTLTSGVVEAAETVGDEAQRAETRKNDVEIINLATDNAALAIEQFLYPNGVDIDPTRLGQLQQLLQKRGLNPADLWRIWKDANMHAERRQLVNDARAAGLSI